jgi:hypothetical protein
MISVTVYAFIFFSNLDNLNHTASLAMFGVVAAVYFLTFVLFCCDPDPFDYFRYAFKKTRTGMAFYYVYAPALIGTAVLVMMMPERTWAPIIPISAMLLYLIAYRPYRERNENIRSAFNMVVMISCLSLRVLLQFSKERKTVDNAFVLNFVNMLLLFAVMVVSYVALIYHIVYTCYLKPKEEKTDEEKVMLEL